MIIIVRAGLSTNHRQMAKDDEAQRGVVASCGRRCTSVGRISVGAKKERKEKIFFKKNPRLQDGKIHDWVSALVRLAFFSSLLPFPLSLPIIHTPLGAPSEYHLSRYVLPISLLSLLFLLLFLLPPN